MSVAGKSLQDFPWVCTFENWITNSRLIGQYKGSSLRYHILWNERFLGKREQLHQFSILSHVLVETRIPTYGIFTTLIRFSATLCRLFLLNKKFCTRLRGVNFFFFASIWQDHDKSSKTVSLRLELVKF